VTAASACLRAIAARHLKGWILRRARNCRFSAALNVASYACCARASYRQATSANTANAIGTAKGIIDATQMAVVYRVPSAHCGDLLEAGNPAEVFARAEIHLTFFQAVYQGWNEAKMIVPAKMFSAMGVWTSLEPQLTTPQPLPTKRP